MVHATHISPQARLWLAESHNGRLLHLFPHACNFVNERGAVLSLVSSDIGPNPLAIVLPSLHLPDFVTVSDTPILTGTKLSVGQLTIDLATAVLWQPIPTWHNPLDLVLLRDIIHEHPDFQTAVPLELASQMQQTLHSHDQAAIQQTARQLAGLGPGLTPAGDDFLVGLMYGLWCQSADFGAQIALIAQTAVPHTTTLSANLLQAAARGEASQAWHDLLTASTTDDVSNTWLVYYERIGRILRTGHSSGSDALFGFLVAQ